MKKELIQILTDLLHIYSPSTKEQEMINYTSNFLKECGFTIEEDNMGNLMAYRGEQRKYVLLNAHMDTCQNESDKPHLSKIFYNKSKDMFQLRGYQIGGDDKAGIAIILYLAKYTDLPFKVLLTVQEEIGRKGAQNIPPSFYRNVCCALSLDRKGSKDIITMYSGKEMCNKDFVGLINDIAEDLGLYYHPASGSIADTYHISEYCPAVNLSVGFYGAHLKDDYLIVQDTYNTLRLTEAFLKNHMENPDKAYFIYLYPIGTYAD